MDIFEITDDLPKSIRKTKARRPSIQGRVLELLRMATRPVRPHEIMAAYYRTYGDEITYTSVKTSVNRLRAEKHKIETTADGYVFEHTAENNEGKS